MPDRVVTVRVSEDIAERLEALERVLGNRSIVLRRLIARGLVELEQQVADELREINRNEVDLRGPAVV